MATEELTTAADPDAPAEGLTGQTYEIIRHRLAQQGSDLRDRLTRLNDSRKSVFGSIETSLLSTERVTTDNNCTPRDMVSVGDQLLFGYNVHVGLRSQVNLPDVFAIYTFGDRKLHAQSLDLLSDAQFEADFAELYKYYRNTTFSKFALRPPYLFIVFRVGKAVDDIKTFKWMVDGNRLKYVDNRSDYEFRYPPQHEFVWQRTTRDQHQAGLHPHVSIAERLFVETIGGDLTLKIENNTDSGEGIYTEPVDNPDQTLDDAEVYYATIGNLILLKIRPYQEQNYRYLVYNEKIQQAQRVDAIADACVLLPDDHGIIFPRGYYLQTGEAKIFETATSDMMFEKQIRSPNGEDFLYIFFNRLEGVYVLLSYNLISQRVSTPTICSGYATFDNGELLSFRHHDEPLKHHAIQIWQTPFTGVDFAPDTNTDSALFKIGNRDLVRGMAECHEILGLIAKDDSYGDLYLDVARRASDILDSYFWITDSETENLAEPLAAIRDASQAAINEFEKVLRQRENTRQEVERVSAGIREIVNTISRERFADIQAFVNCLTRLRSLRGDVISLRDLKYVDPPAIDALEQEVSRQTDQLSQRCVDFLLQENALAPYQDRVAAQADRSGTLGKVADVKLSEEEVGATAAELELLIDIVSNLKIDDATQRTAIIDAISAIYATLNQVRAQLKTKKTELMSVEGAAEFGSQLKLLDQAVVNYLDVCDTPQRCEEYLTKLMIQVEELEGRFAEFDAMIAQLSEKREELYNAFESRKLQLVEARNRRAGTLMKSAERILNGIRTRVDALESVSEINGYLAGDLMVDKLRDIVRQLSEMDDSVKADDLQSQLKTIREDAVRQLKDRQELYVDGQNLLQLGRHTFSVNVQALDLTTVMRDEEMYYHLTGTSFFERITDEALLATRPVWQQEIVSENDDVYRAEYAAYQMLQHAAATPTTTAAERNVPSLAQLATLDRQALGKLVQAYIAPRYAEGYIKGVHDADATAILHEMVQLTSQIGLLRYRPAARTMAWLFWTLWDDAARKPVLAARLAGCGEITALFPETTTQAECVQELQQRITSFFADLPFDSELAEEAGEYLFFALAGGTVFVISGDAEVLLEDFRSHLAARAHSEAFQRSLENVRSHTLSAFLLARDWVQAFLAARKADAERRPEDLSSLVDEVAQLLLEGEFSESRVVHASTVRTLPDLIGSHPRISSGTYRLNFHDFTARLKKFAQVVVPRFTDYTHLKHAVVERRREELRLAEFRPRVLTSFVRNKLIDHVYLPLVGDNLAKQLGTAGDTTRTDRMGLLLLISPPGYGKTTLMEYIANRLGLIFMKINGPAIGHQVTSLDPAEAPNAAAREEVEKLNLALEMGDNVMIYLDDIQHVSPELLQKFISLCDATRKIEGVYQGRTRTYDLRGKKVCVVMAGNPYTESGERFQIPDMLTNRADTYNLGEIIGDNSEWFELSYLENALTSNPTLSHLASKSPHDVLPLIKMAETESQDPADLEGNYALDELNEFVGTLKKLLFVRDTVLRVNREYIRSAGQADAYRTEPAFKLQGSYRNMNRIAERVSPLMNDHELQSLVVSQYEQDAQTLTTGTEANLLKFKELIGILSETESHRWNDIKKTFTKNVKLSQFGGDNQVAQVVSQMSDFAEGLDGIRAAVAGGVEQICVSAAADAENSQPADAEQLAAAIAHLDRLGTGLDGLREVVAEGARHLAGPPAAVAATFAPETAELLTRFVSELQLAAGQPALPPTGVTPSDRIQVQVVNKVPRLFLSIIREQFRLMQEWMRPLTEVTKENSEGLADIQTQLSEAMQNYDAMIDKLEETE